jgi:hypothetical protein
MMVKVGNKTYNSEQEPLMIIFEESEKEMVSQMRKTDKKFCVHPESMTQDEVFKFMR